MGIYLKIRTFKGYKKLTFVNEAAIFLSILPPEVNNWSGLMQPSWVERSGFSI